MLVPTNDIAAQIEQLDKQGINAVITCYLFDDDDKSARVVSTRGHRILVYRYQKGKYSLAFSYEDKYSYTCVELTDRPELRTRRGACFVTSWEKFGDYACVIVGQRGGKIVPLFRKYGGKFEVEYADINNDGYTDILVTEQKRTFDGGPRLWQPDKTAIYLRKWRSQSDRFVYTRTVPWRNRFGKR